MDEPTGVGPGRAQHPGDGSRLRPLPLGPPDARLRASPKLAGPSGKYEGDRKAFVEQVRQALYASKIVSYAQGYVQMQAAAAEYNWPLAFGSIALLWRGGCIIRAVFLERIKEAFDADPKLENLLLARYFQEATAHAQDAWRNVVATAVRLGIPTPAFSTRWPITTAIAAPACRPICSRPSAITSGPTRISEWIARESFIATGCVCEKNRSRLARWIGTPPGRGVFDLADLRNVNLISEEEAPVRPTQRESHERDHFPDRRIAGRWL